MQQLQPVDVVIAGGGLVGLTLAKEITARTSLSVVALERGGPRKTADYATGMDELDHALRYRMMQNLSEETVTHRHSMKANAVPIRQYGSFNPGTGVGGAAEHWGAICYRFYPEHFTLGTFLREKGGRLPENVAVQDWGFRYDDIEPYYWKAEQLLAWPARRATCKENEWMGETFSKGRGRTNIPTRRTGCRMRRRFSKRACVSWVITPIRFRRPP
jgi:gluconate 2-dehydrogenase alpha chain